MIKYFPKKFSWLLKFFLINFFFGKFLWLWKISMTVEKFIDQFFCRKFFRSNFLWKFSLTVKNFLDRIFCTTFLWSKFFVSLTMENLLDYEKTPWIRKISLTVENLLSWLQKIITLLILKPLWHIFLVWNRNLVHLPFLG